MIRIRITRKFDKGDYDIMKDEYIPKLKKAFQSGDVNPNQFVWEIGNEKIMEIVK